MFPLPHLALKPREKLETGFLLPLRNIVLLPGVTLPVVAGRPRSVSVAESVMMTEQKQVIIAAVRPEAVQKLEKEEKAEIESLEELYPIATLAVVHKMLRLPVGPIQLIIEGQERVRIEQLLQTEPTYIVKFERLPNLTVEAAIAAGAQQQSIQALTSALKSLWQEAASLNPNFPEEVLTVLLNIESPAQLAYQTAILLQQEVPKMQTLLEQNDLELLLRQVLADLQKEIEVLRLRGEILGETKKEIDQQQKEFFLRQQLKKIQEELGEVDSEKQEIEELRSRLATANLPEPAEKQAKRELARLERIGSASAEGGVIRTYLDWLLEMPWNKTVEDNLDLQNAREVLDADHYGLSKIKDRIIEHLATFKLKRMARNEDTEEEKPERHDERYSIGTVICFVGPPGTGKTSLGRSIARALGRPFERIGLGGLRDEAELRGHRRTYIGAMPGRIVQALHRAGVKNPVIMLDELDKIGMDYRGDPASVLLEILDPQQNYSFRDLYLDLDFDLSQILFIGTANDLSRVPAPLLDRLEIIELSGYSEEEKLAIAEQYLLPRQIEKAGLPANAVQLSTETLRQIIELYTREAGVRKLEQQLGTLCRKVAVRYASGETRPTIVHPEQLEELLGPPHFWREEKRKVSRPGVATGLAWTVQGGEILFVEAVLLPQGKDLTLTGQLGEVMQESAKLAYSYIWSNADALGIDVSAFKSNGLHLHVPAGAIPKDGPSAGVTMVVAIASLLTNQPVRTDTAMTGEIDLSGEVLPIGGVREKVLAARRAGITRIILPKQNEKDLAEVPQDAREKMEFILCDRIEQVLENALVRRQMNQPVV
ncbi:MAG: endopeptidase La [Hydrococcus sp. C42_A2020_068]|uniref:endopeptidase La n=1 Tax=Pleurocapsa sp. PCC 7327 TaxID=118163 RepID=UPI00029FEEDB|nr:endopeptidase La [Pleurocapsa sp. PCC 7327]AFY79625.1 ATP-dependent protease La [Pleurocapsa sp. PCC 7327]MBF2021200.1 endopeptidase La [Hydrococcus sp. C42_A2020_068]